MCRDGRQRGKRVALLEHSGQPGRKILISGGGRCNFTNLHCTAENFISKNPHFAKSALAGYQPRHFLEIVERHGIKWHEKKLGQLFCDGSAQQILRMLLEECEKGAVELNLNAREIAIERAAGEFRVYASCGEWRSSALVIASGGLSIPSLGATGLGYRVAQQFGMNVIEPRPALVPLVLGGDESRWRELAGVAAEVEARACIPIRNRGPLHFRERMLLTHRGLSGPAVLQASSYWREGEPLILDLAPEKTAVGALLNGRATTGGARDATALRHALGAELPQRMAAFLVEMYPPRGWSNRELEAWERGLHAWEFHPIGTEGFAKAEVTAGGVDTDGLNASTLEAKTVPAMFFVGEVVDVTGQLGGFNFQWAWASAVAAARSL